MYDTVSYIQDAISFSKSLVIKFKDVAVAVNNGVYVAGYDIDPDARKWKYYLNMAGIRHESNQDVLVNVIETGKQAVLSRELMEDYPYTHEQLCLLDERYDSLVERYPGEEDFIRGCLFPVEVDKSLAAEDGTILNYRKDYVRYNECNLIREIETFIQGFIKRWHVRAYTLTDDLYLPAFLGVLYTSIPHLIINSKLDKIQTNEADAFHLEHFFRSRLNIWEVLDLLDDRTQFWLYNNLDYIKKNIGKDRTFNIMVNKILEPNKLGLGEYIIKQNDNELSEDPNELNDLKVLPFKKGETKILTKPLNDSYNLSANQEKTLERAIMLELNMVETKDDNSDLTTKNNYLIQQTSDEINDKYLDNQKTKMLDVGVGILSKSFSFDLFKVVLDHWVYVIKHNRDHETGLEINKEPIIDYTDPNNSKTYAVTPTVGLLMLVKLMLLITGNEEQKISSLSFTYTLPEREKTLDQVGVWLYDNGYIWEYISEFKRLLPTPLPYFSQREEFKKYIDRVSNFYAYVWDMDANSESVATSGLIKQLFYYSLLRDRFVISKEPDTIDNILKTYGIEYALEDNADLNKSIEALLLAFTGVRVDEYYYIKTMLQNTKSLIGKLTSYTVQVLSDNSNESSNPSFYNNIECFKVRKGLIGEIEGTLEGLEKNNPRIVAGGVNFTEEPDMIYISNMTMRSAFCRKTIEGDVDIYKGPLKFTSPSYVVEMIKPLVMDTRNCPHEDMFILDIKGTFDPIERNEPKVKADGNNTSYSHNFMVSENTLTPKVSLDRQDVQGTVEIDIPEVTVSFVE